MLNLVLDFFQCGRMVLKHFQDKAAAAARAEKEEEQRLRKVASFVAKEIRTFWTNVEKVGFYDVKLCAKFNIFSDSAGGVQTTNPIGGEAKTGAGSAFKLHSQRNRKVLISTHRRSIKSFERGK